MAISHMVTGRRCHHPAISIYLALSQTCSPDTLELHLSGLGGGLGLGLGLDPGLGLGLDPGPGLGLDPGPGPGPRRPVTLCSCRRGGGLTDRERNRPLPLPAAGTRLRAGKLAFPLKSKTRFFAAGTKTCKHIQGCSQSEEDDSERVSRAGASCNASPLVKTRCYSPDGDKNA